MEARPLLAGGVAGLALLLVAGGGWWIVRSAAGKIRPNARPLAAGAAPSGSAPTVHRRDLLLIDEGGKTWRFAGVALHPNLTLGGDAAMAGYLAGDDIAQRHAQLWVRDGRLVLRRAGEAPVFLNDRLLPEQTPEIVSTGDTIRLGRATFRVAID